ncbi:DUF3037 domain-containing protein [Pseudoalteromonas ruthenica]|uniref:DUF3037 domain-containing protein n=1 Tax=Pseudoalteromonas ruthenica TaxID=151081 RepID=UPI00241E1B6F|nr:DUF3037 domain-containing protein [Pseudoalteromonas ruthenica]|tara:strand:- start:500 stop:1339 length:840 start_codon:yes stop_codon:yes gene_type:complete
MKQLCTYAIVRFMPFSETQEFANVGILLVAPKTGYVSYKLAPKSFARITHFFDDLEGNIYRCAMSNFEQELIRVREISSGFTGHKQVKIIEEVTRLREGIVSFSDMRALLHEDPQEALQELYERYIARNFITKQYREQQMVKALRQDLRKHISNVHYTKQKLHADYNVQVELPFVTKDCHVTKAIKPLSFSQSKPLSLIEHGEQWINRIKRLIKANSIKPHNMLFAIEKPKSKKDEMVNAYGEVKEEMESLDIRIALFEEKQKIYEFASDLDNGEFRLS